MNVASVCERVLTLPLVTCEVVNAPVVRGSQVTEVGVVMQRQAPIDLLTMGNKHFLASLWHI